MVVFSSPKIPIVLDLQPLVERVGQAFLRVYGQPVLVLAFVFIVIIHTWCVISIAQLNVVHYCSLFVCGFAPCRCKFKSFAESTT